MENQKTMYSWVVLILLFLNIFFCLMAVNCMPPLFSEIVKEIPLTKAQMGAVFGAVTLASLFFAPLGGGLSDKIGCRWVLGGGALMVAAGGGLRFFVGGAIELILCMFFIGAGFAVFLAIMPKALSTWFPPQELAKVNGICFSSIGFGGAIAMATAAGFLAPAFNGWRGTTVVLASISLAMGILWVLFYRDRQTVADDQSKKGNILANFKTVLRIKDIWLLALYYGFMMTALMAIIALLPITLEEKGVARSGQLVSILMGTSVIFNIVGGAVSDKVGKRKPFLIVCAIVFGICIPAYLVFTGVPLVLILIFAGAALGPTAPIVMTIPVEIEQIGSSLAGTALGFILMIGNTGSFFGPIIAGTLMDVSGSAWTGFIFMSAVAILAALIVVPLTRE
jgi:cyanate permease